MRPGPLQCRVPIIKENFQNFKKERFFKIFTGLLPKRGWCQGPQPSHTPGSASKKDVKEDNTSDHLENEEEGEGGSDEDDGEGEKVKKGGHHFPQAGLLRPLQVTFRLKSNRPLSGHVFHIQFHRN